MGDQMFRDPNGEFDSPQQALGFVEARQKLAGALGQQTNPAELVRAVSEIQTHYPQQTINWAMLHPRVPARPRARRSAGNRPR